MKTSSPHSELYRIQPGCLVRVLDDNGTDMGFVGIYIDLVIPASLGLATHDLLSDIEHIDARFQERGNGSLPSQFFYTLPEHWHHVILAGERPVHLNAGFYTIVELEGDGQP